MSQRVGVVAAIAAAAFLGASAAPASADLTTTATFANPGSYQFTVPAGVSSITVTAIGAAGGTCVSNPGTGGQGATVTATVPVTAGDQLFVGVGGRGSDSSCQGGSGPTAGGVGGGGDGGAGGSGLVHFGGVGGGGASVIGLASPLPGNGSLVVAGGGGGAALFTNGGNAGAPGQTGSISGGGGGGAGTLSGGGAGGAAGDANAGAGASGSPGVGGHGGFGDAAGQSSGGGGGGGGYYGGGGGGGSANQGFGGGGGGGSSFVVSGATGVTGPTPTGASSEVTITYDVPTADESTGSLNFGTQPQGTASAEQDLTVTNNGSATLIVGGVLLSGSNPGDYLIDNHQCLGGVAPGASCVIGVRFDPQAAGASSATMTVVTNAPTAPVVVSLSGTGGSLPQGATGPQGPPGPAGKIELVTCKTVIKHHHKVHRCKGKLVSGTVNFTATGKLVHATVSRGGVMYASGESVPAAGGGSTLVLKDRRRLRRGSYTLTLRSREVVRRITIAIG